jgi:MATE family multidrug resistance protein
MALVSIYAISFNVYAEEIAGIFTKDKATISVIASVLPTLSIFVLLDGLHGVQAGNIRALGQQGIVSLLSLLCYYAIGLPLAIWLGFYAGYSLNGFWYGYIVSMSIVDVLVLVIIYRSSWVANFVYEAIGTTTK